MSVSIALSDYRAMSQDQLSAAILMGKKAKFNLRFQKATGQLTDTSEIRKARRNLARLETVKRQKALGAYDSRKVSLDKADKTRQDARPSRRAARRAENQRFDNLPDAQLRRTMRLMDKLRAPGSKKQISAMRALRGVEHGPGAARHFASSLVRFLESKDQRVAVEAAITICCLTHPERYASIVDRSKLLECVRADLPEILHDRNIDFVVHADAKKIGRNEVEVEARLSERLPFDLDGRPTRLVVPDWMTAKSKDFQVRVSGANIRSDSVRIQRAPLGGGDLGAFVVRCSVDDKANHEVNVDFVIGDQFLKREKVFY